MIKINRHFRNLCAIAAAAITFMLSAVPVYAQEETSIKKILFIGSEELDSYASAKQIQGLKSSLSSDVQLSIQFMESQIISDDENYSRFYNRISSYIRDNEFDAFIVSGDEALDFAYKYDDDLFAVKTVLFLGAKNTDLIRRCSAMDNITGIKDVLYFDENVLLAKRLFPAVKRIYLITDDSLEGLSGAAIFNELNKRFKGIEFVNLDTQDLPIDRIQNFLSDAGKTDAVFFLSAHGIPGTVSSDVKFILNSCSKNNVPVFSCTYGNLGTGVLGGYFNSYYDVGSLIGKMLNEVFEGVDPRFISVSSDAPARYFFDYSVMTKYDLSKRQLPEDTVYLNDKSIFNRNGLVWILATVMLTLISLITIVLNVNNRHRNNKLEDMLKESRNMLHAVMDQSETVYWECDFTEDQYAAEEEQTEGLEEIEELESVDDETPLGKVQNVEEEDILEIPSIEGLSGRNFGLNTQDVVLGWIYSGVIQREYREQFNQVLKDFKEGKTKRSIEIDIPIGIEDIRNNVQTERWKHIVYRAIKTKGDQVVRAICSATDVTSQKRAEREYEGIMKYQSFVQQNYPAYTRLNLTKNIVLERFINLPDIGKMIKGNSAVSELEFLRTIITTRGQNHSFANTLDREDLIIAFKNGARQKTCDFCYKFTNGVIHWFNLCMELAFNPSSGDIEAYCYLKDISNQTIATITKDSVLEEDVEYIFWLNKVNGVCQFINKSEDVSWISEKDTADYKVMIDTFIKKKVPDSDKESVRELFDVGRIENELETQKEVRFTYHTRKDDGSIEIKQEKVYYLEPGGNIIVFVGTDITAITLMESQQNEKLAKAIKEAERANFAKSDFLSRMSHDLRTPMNGIMGIAELASKELDDPVSLERDISKIKSASKYMLGLLNDILDMSKIESGRMEIRKEKCSFGDILENVITLSHVMCDKNGIDFFCNRNPDDYRDFILNIDRLHMQQIAMNLISNASKYTPEGGKIEILLDSVPVAPGVIKIHVEIRDTGAGMTKEFQKIMYEAFTQDINSVNKVGTGLGLAIVHNLVNLMGGTIECVSAPGEGTQFTIEMNIEVVDTGNGPISSDQGTVEETKDVSKLSIKGKRALLVEDNELNQEIASRLLIAEGLEVDIAGNGLEALNMFSEKPEGYYDIVCMDVMMPVMDGLQATHLMRGLEREDAKKIPIIAMTANAFTEDIERCLEAGMNTHIAKPIETEKMIRTVKEFIGE